MLSTISIITFFCISLTVAFTFNKNMFGNHNEEKTIYVDKVTHVKGAFSKFCKNPALKITLKDDLHEERHLIWPLKEFERRRTLRRNKSLTFSCAGGRTERVEILAEIVRSDDNYSDRKCDSSPPINVCSRLQTATRDHNEMRFILGGEFFDATLIVEQSSHENIELTPNKLFAFAAMACLMLLLAVFMGA